jgi:hypothetical protein
MEPAYPVVKAETEGRAGKVKGEPAHTREAKIGSVFTQTTWDKEGYAIRDPDSTTYVAAIESAGEFGPRLYLEAWNRGWERAEKKVVIGDGAEWIWNIADDHFPGAFRSSTSFTPASTFGMWPANSIRARRPNRNAGWRFTRMNCWMKAKSKNWWPRSVPSIHSSGTPRKDPHRSRLL